MARSGKKPGRGGAREGTGWMPLDEAGSTTIHPRIASPTHLEIKAHQSERQWRTETVAVRD
jgi:hypothetical protein